jgi:hypothetical protein
VRSLVDVVKKEHVVLDSEYLVTLIVAVPKYVSVLSEQLFTRTGYQELDRGPRINQTHPSPLIFISINFGVSPT